MAGSDNTPLISIIIPTLQEEKLIGRTLEQFSNGLRDRYSLEVIVSDGGSTDRTVPLAQGKSDLVVCNHNGCAENISIGRNRGAGAARGSQIRNSSSAGWST